jgi:hypothetical protein
VACFLSLSLASFSPSYDAQNALDDIDIVHVCFKDSEMAFQLFFITGSRDFVPHISENAIICSSVHSSVSCNKRWTLVHIPIRSCQDRAPGKPLGEQGRYHERYGRHCQSFSFYQNPAIDNFTWDSTENAPTTATASPRCTKYTLIQSVSPNDSIYC